MYANISYQPTNQRICRDQKYVFDKYVDYGIKHLLAYLWCWPLILQDDMEYFWIYYLAIFAGNKYLKYTHKIISEFKLISMDLLTITQKLLKKLLNIWNNEIAAASDHTV